MTSKTRGSAGDQSAFPVDIRLRAIPTRIERLTGGTLVVHATIAGHEERFEADRLLIATGRRPHGLSALGLETAGIVGDPTHGIQVDETLRTTAPNIWAIGDASWDVSSARTSPPIQQAWLCKTPSAAQGLGTTHAGFRARVH